MDKARTFWLANEHVRARAKDAIDAAPTGWCTKIFEPKRSDRQNRMLHAMMNDIITQLPDHAAFSMDDTKKRFMNAFGREMRWLPCIDGKGQFPIGLSTSDMSKTEFAAFQEFVFSYASPRGVVWSEPHD